MMFVSLFPLQKNPTSGPEGEGFVMVICHDIGGFRKEAYPLLKESTNIKFNSILDLPETDC